MGALGNLTGLVLPAVGVAEAVAAAGELGALLLAAAPCAGGAPFSRSWRAAGYYTENHKAAGQHVKYRTSNTEGRKAEGGGGALPLVDLPLGPSPAPGRDRERKMPAVRSGP